MSRPVDVLAVIRRHAESHRASAESDAYSAQEAPRLEDACAAFAELIEAAEPAVTEEGMDQQELNRLRAALARARGAA